MYRAADGRFMSFFGDLHPSFAGNVVKAMGGAKQGYPVLTRTMETLPASKRSPAEILGQANAQWRARVVRVDRLTPTIVEVVVEAPAAARNFEPGQFYRLQNYEARSKKVDGTLLTMEGLALTGAWVDKDKGLLSLITLEMGGSSDLCTLLEPGEPVIVMGPTGTPTEIEPGETVVLAGGGLGNAVLFSIGQAFRKAGSKVLYFAGYKKPQRPLQGRGDRGGGRRRRLGLRRGSRASPSTGRRTSRWSTTSSRPCAATPRASSASSRSPSRTPTASSPSARTA